MENISLDILKDAPWAAVCFVVLAGWMLHFIRMTQKEQREDQIAQQERHDATVKMILEDTNKRNEARNENQKYIIDKCAEIGEALKDVQETNKRIIEEVADIHSEVKEVKIEVKQVSADLNYHRTEEHKNV
jgi:hypothetical protein